jgi:hypothetical protein
VPKKEKEDKKKKSASKPTTPLSLIRGAMGHQTDWGPLLRALESVKGDAPAIQFEDLFGLASISPMLSLAYPASHPISSALPFIQAVSRLEPVDFYKELAWALTALSYSAERIQAFIKYRDIYFKATSAGRTGEAILTLNKIDKNCGMSLWSIENRIALLSLQGGFENQRTFVSALNTKYKRTFISFFATNISERNETRVSLEGFENRLRERARSWTIKSDQIDYIFYKLLGTSSNSLISAANLISFEGSSSAIDLYETVLDQLCAVHSNPNIKIDPVVHSIRTFGELLEDHCLRHLELLYLRDKPDVPSTQAIEVQPALELFLQGRYDNCVDLVNAILSDGEVEGDVVSLAAQLGALGYAVRCRSQGLASAYIRHLSSYLRYGPESTESAENIRKLSLNFRHIPYTASLGKYAETDRRFSLIPMTITAAVRSKRVTPCSFIALTSKTGTVFENRSLQSLAWHFEIVSKGLSSSSSREEFSAEVTNCAGYEKKVSAQNFGQAIGHLDALELSPHTYFSREAMLLKAWALFNDGLIVECLVHSVRTAVSLPALRNVLPIDAVLRSRGFKELKELQREPVLSIGLKMYIERTDDRFKEVALQVAWKQFLKQYGIEKPSELDVRIGEFNLEEIVYFLREVCVQEVMELGSAFNSPNTLDEERLQICVLLTRIDPPRADDYNTEIIELTRRLSIEEGVKHVESSRVYVDIFGLERWASIRLQESFLRYMDYAAAGLQASAAELEKKLVKMLKGGMNSRDVSNFLDSYDVTADSILAEIIEEASTAFMSLPRYGLDAFLGSRVRHGSLEGAFRGSLERRKLVTKRESASGNYDKNAHWSDLGQKEKPFEQAKVDETLKNFCRGVDSLIDMAVTRYVYVRTDANQDGLISLWPNDELRRQSIQRWLIDVKLKLQPGATAGQLVNYCVATFFWPLLDQSLEGIRRFVVDHLGGEICKLLQQLQSDITNTVGAERAAGFISHVRAAQHDVKDAGEMIAEWFVTQQKNQNQLSFQMKTAIEIGLKSTQRIRQHFHPTIHWDVDPRANVTLHTSAFEIISDISFLIFGNVSEHAGFPERGLATDPKPGIHITLLFREPNLIDIRVESDIGEDADESQIVKNLEIAKAQISARNFEESSKKKRGTGLVRLASTLNYEGVDDKVVDFGLTSNLRFYVYLSAPQFYYTVTNQSKVLDEKENTFS